MKTDIRNRRRALFAGAAAPAIALALMATSVHAQEPAKSFSIAPQPLADALLQLSRQADVDIVASTDLTRGRTAPRVDGQMTTADAMSALLAGSGLVAAPSGAGYVITRAADPQSGSAAGDGADAGTVQALIVTAQKREEDIQDVPIAISAFTQEDLTRSQVAGGPDLITQVPNMTFTKTNFSSYTIQLRGIGTQAISATTDPAVAVAFNNTPFIRNRFFEQEFYDLQRIEVLRGPQGTLYGRNATAGVVNILSAKPKFNYESKLSADVGNYSSHRIEGMVNIPLAEDKVAIRLAGAWTKRDGYVTNDLTGNPIDGRDLWSTRVSLRVAPNDRIDANLIWEHFQENDDRLRSGKQLCKKDVVTNVGGVPITNYFDTSIEGSGNNLLFSGIQARLSQGCTRNSLYANDSFQRPNGLMLPYYTPLSALGLPTAYAEPYIGPFNVGLSAQQPLPLDPALVSATNDQPEGLRVIESIVDPKYRADSDLGELQVSFDLTDALTLTSETSYSVDYVYSLQDFNRFNSASGAWNASGNPNLVSRGVLSPEGVFCDPQLGCSDRLVAVDVSTAKSRQFSQELRLSSDFDGPFNFSVGANFLRYDTEDKYYVFINSLSLAAAVQGGTDIFDATTPYVAGVTDNSDCLADGYAQGDPNEVYGVNDCTYIDPNPIGNVNDQGHNYFLSRNPYKLISYAAFGEAYYQIASNLKLTAGLRWTVDKKDAPRIPTWLLVSQSVGYPVAEVIEQEWREPTGRLALDWKPDLSFTDETMLYGSYAHGYKAGGANPPGFVVIYYNDISVAYGNSGKSATRPRVFDPEFVDAFELGAKNRLFNDAVTLNLAGFYYDYKDYQISEIVDRSAYNRNFDATVWGLELEADWRPIENLRFGLKGGYEKTRIADGQQAIDLMDRANGGQPDENGISWLVVRPFPTYASSCIIPTYVYVNPDGTLGRVGQVGGGGLSPCETAYGLNLDPVTGAPYVDLTTTPAPPTQTQSNLNTHPGYPGFDPSTAPNGGEGIMKPLGGNELPNAPHWTATTTADYTVPLANNWLMTLHTDVHWQSQSWWRVFNDHVYDKLHPYFTMNLAAIFTNEDAGWNIMAYIKNVTDETAITGAFLNSDDTGLPTNVFLTEPRLYGVRVTKAWTGGSLLGNFGAPHDGPYPLTVELGAQVQRHDAPNTALQPTFGALFDGPLAVFADAQKRDLDWGDGREVRVTWRPGGAWMLSAGLHHDETNGLNNPAGVEPTPEICGFGGPYAVFCTLSGLPPEYVAMQHFTETNRIDTTVYDHEQHDIAELMVGRDFQSGWLSQSSVAAGLRYARLQSDTNAEMKGIPDWFVAAGFFPFLPVAGSRTLYRADIQAEREFKGAGPVIEWNAALPLLKVGESGAVALEWTAGGGVLFGKRKAQIDATQDARFSSFDPGQLIGTFRTPTPTNVPVTPFEPARRSESGTVPVYGGSLGLSYAVGAVKLDGGYRWERYVNAIDGGFQTQKSYDRTIDGPYFKIAVGFGG